MITIFTQKIEYLSEDDKNKIINSLSEDAQARLNKKRNEKLYLASLCALSLLTNEQKGDLSYRDNGAPFFKTINSDISISHSTTYVAVAISSSKEEPIGIDIEEDLPKEKSFPFSRFLTESEQKQLKSGTPYIKIWTKKEALYKYLKDNNTPFIKLDSTSIEEHKAKFITLQIENNTLTVCAKNNAIIKLIQQ